MNIYIAHEGRRDGPFTSQQASDLVRQGKYSLSDLAWHEGMSDWKQMHLMPEVVNLVLPQLPGKADEQPAPTLPPPLPVEPPVIKRLPPQTGTNAPANEIVTDEELGLFVQSNRERYLKKWKTLGSRKQSWNWAAFLLGEFWMIYRKMYLTAAVFLAFSYGLNVLISNSGLLWIINISTTVFIGIFGDYMFKRHSERAIRRIFVRISDPQLRRDAIIRRGDTNLGLAVVCVLAFILMIAWSNNQSEPHPGRGPGSSTGANSSQTPAPAPPSPTEIATRLKQSTVILNGGFTVDGTFVNDDYAWFGSGVIIERDRNHYYILSNAHVVGIDEISDAKWFVDPTILAYKLTVTLPDGPQTPATEIWVNSYLKDFAIIAVDASAGNYPTLPLIPGQADVGAQVYAMGTPLGLNNTFSSGMVSAYLAQETLFGASVQYIQHTAPISHGNSGGPLVNGGCNLIGINTLNMNDGSAQNLNFAISAEEILQSSNQWIKFPLTPANIGPFVVKLKKGEFARSQASP